MAPKLANADLQGDVELLILDHLLHLAIEAMLGEGQELLNDTTRTYCADNSLRLVDCQCLSFMLHDQS